jgi:hypothetical protein
VKQVSDVDRKLGAQDVSSLAVFLPLKKQAQRREQNFFDLKMDQTLQENFSGSSHHDRQFRRKTSRYKNASGFLSEPLVVQ